MISNDRHIIEDEPYSYKISFNPAASESMKVALVGATGETGQSIVNGLLDSATNFVSIAFIV